MQFKKSAGVFLTGLILSVVGGVGATISASIAAAAAAARSLYSSSGGSTGAAVMAFIFGLLSLIGFIMLCQGAYRALVKIDALPVPAPEKAAENMPENIPAQSAE